MKNMLKFILFLFTLLTYQLSFSMTVDEFNASAEKLEGKTKDEVVSVLGKPAGYQTSRDQEYFRYEGIKDKYTGKSSTASVIFFQNGKLNTKTFPPRHYFDKLPF